MKLIQSSVAVAVAVGLTPIMAQQTVDLCLGEGVSMCFGDEEFVLFDMERSQPVAKVLCNEAGGELARIGNAFEYDIVMQLKAQTSVDRFYIGIEDDAKSDASGTSRFSFVDGNSDDLDFIHTAVGAFPWGYLQPNNYDDLQHCVMWQRNTNLFNDEECFEDMAFLCRRPCSN